MLSRLTIDNYALIDHSDLNLNEGFTVITGETGAGKSIMLDALGLLMGNRADSKAMGNKERKTIVEGVFTKPDGRLKKLFEDNGIDWDNNELIIRREISQSGKSRGFINDTPVNLTLLSEVSENLLDIHSQHSNTLLNKPSQQLAIIDSFGNNGKILEAYRTKFKEYVTLRNKIKTIKEAREKGKENKEFILFRLEQLEKIKPKRGELAELEREFEILGDADRIKTDLSEANALLDGTSVSALRMIQNVSLLIDNLDLDLLDPEGNDNIRERIDNLKIELRDIADTLEGYSEKISSDPQRFEKLRARIELLYETMKRFKVKDEGELVDLYEELKEELSSINGDNVDLTSMEAELKEDAKALKEEAEKLTKAREKAGTNFSEELERRIKQLGMPNARFQVNFTKGKLSSDGQDTLTFYCSFNKNHEMEPVAAIASGGEIARVMLSIKSMMSENMNLPTIIFDEIDTGVSGEIAHKMGRMMKEMSEHLQVLSVTHLPQVAATGKSHLKVYKDDKSGKTISHIRELDEAERVKEIAAMISGSIINEAALENARILLSSE